MQLITSTSLQCCIDQKYIQVVEVSLPEYPHKHEKKSFGLEPIYYHPMALEPSILK